jgi:transposase InsO family protein
MPFWGVSAMEQRVRFLAVAGAEGSNVRSACRAFAISPTTGYKWLARAAAGEIGERSRRPHRSPRTTGSEREAAVVAVRLEHPTWGGRKIHHTLRLGGVRPVPHANTITDILHRHRLIEEQESDKRRPWQRFEKASPNELWQMDFKGHFALRSGARCHPLTVVDDHSRYGVVVKACGDERRASVEAALIEAFRRYGLPDRMLMDNGAPWGKDFEHRHTRLTAWLMRLGVEPIHGRPFHPQTQGKNERFNGTLKREVVSRESFADLAAAQRRFDAWLEVYNRKRPHQAIGDVPPACRYREATRRFPDRLAPIVYDADCVVRRVSEGGCIGLHSRRLFVSYAFVGHPVGLRPTDRDGVFEVLFCRYRVGRLDLTGAEQHGMARLARAHQEDGRHPRSAAIARHPGQASDGGSGGMARSDDDEIGGGN